MGVTGSNPVSRTIFLGDFRLNPQDISTIQDIWAHGCSISEVWKAHKTQQQLVDVSLAQAITEYIEHLKGLRRSRRYIKEVGWVLRQYKAAMPSNLPLKLHTTCAGWEAVKKLAQSGDQKIPFVLLLLLGAPARIHRQTH